MNGCATLTCNDAEHYLSGAHAVLTMYAVSEDECSTVNPSVRRSALGAAITMVELGLWQMRHDHFTRRAA